MGSSVKPDSIAIEFAQLASKRAMGSRWRLRLKGLVYAEEKMKFRTKTESQHLLVDALAKLGACD